MFERMAADTGHPDRYEVAEFPLWRGATEFHLRRLHHDAPGVALVSLGPMTTVMRQSVVQDAGFPFASMHEGPQPDGDREALVDTLEAVDTDLVWLVDGSTLVGGCDPIWDAVKWFELLPDVIAVCGRSVDDRGVLSGGADLFDPVGTPSIVSPLAGHTPNDPGPYALALKPHSIDVIDLGSVVARRDALITLLASSDDTDSPGRIVFDPLLTRAVASEQRQQMLMQVNGSGRSGLQPLLAAQRTFR